LITINYARISEQVHQRLMNAYLPDFSSEYQDRIRRYRRWEDAQLSLLGRVLLKQGMENLNYKFDESKLKYTSFDKPYFEDDHVHFNISHSGHFVVCAITELGEIGIDIEKINPIDIDSFKPQMTNYEWNTINESKNSMREFFAYWSQKEAVIKAHGEGLSIALKSFEVKNNATTIGSENFYLRELSISEDYSCHIAYKDKLEAMDITLNKINSLNFSI